MPSNPHDTDATVRFTLEVTMPRHVAPAMLEALTGFDDDIILAGERAMRDRLESEELEIWTPRGLREMLEGEAATEARCQHLYGPPA